MSEPLYPGAVVTLTSDPHGAHPMTVEYLSSCGLRVWCCWIKSDGEPTGSHYSREALVRCEPRHPIGFTAGRIEPDLTDTED